MRRATYNVRAGTSIYSAMKEERYGPICYSRFIDARRRSFWGAAIQALHAQAKPPVYQVTLQEVSDAAALEKEFVPLARPTVRGHGGRPLASSANPIAIEGPAPKFRAVINQWDSVEQVREWNKSADYQKAREVGNKYAKFQIFAVEGLPQ